MTRPLIAARAAPSTLVRRLTAKARRIAEARFEVRFDRRWDSPRALWPLFTAKFERSRHA